MSDLERKFHETWLGMAQPHEGLVVSIVVLTDAQCMQRHSPAEQQRLIELVGDEKPSIGDFGAFYEQMLGLKPAYFDSGSGLPDDLKLEVIEGKGQTLRPTRALKRRSEVGTAPVDGLPDDSVPASRAGAQYAMLVWELPQGMPLDDKESITGDWHYEPQAKFDRLLRACRVPLGLLTNGEELRLVYAPHGESTGHLTFRLKDLVTPGARPLLDALLMLLHSRRFFAVEEERSLLALVEQSRRRQASVTEALAVQVYEALQILLTGFQTASERDGAQVLRDALERGGDHVYGGLLTVLLRLVFVLYAEDRSLLPVDAEPYGEDLSVKALFEQLQRDAGSFPDAMGRRFGAWPRLLTLFRIIFLGARHDAFSIPSRQGELFDPETYPFLEGWSVGGAPVNTEARAALKVPSVDDDTVYRILDKLLVLEGQRLSYRALDVEQIGSVYEALMGYHVTRMVGAGVCVRPSRSWVDTAALADTEPSRRASWIEALGVDAKAAKTIAEGAKKSANHEDFVTALEPVRERRVAVARPGSLVLQPGPERRRTSSHYTPRSLSEPIVRRALEPLFMAMGETPTSERILNLKVCDPAMGSGAFLVEACRFLGNQLVAAWGREGQVDLAPKGDDIVMRARRLVAQRCLYGVDKNPFAVSLAKLSLWLVTLAKNEPFTFLDHALRCGDSLVGLDVEQMKAFHWRPEKQLDWAEKLVEGALKEALATRAQILELATEFELPGAKPRQMELDPALRKQELLRQADEALEPIRQIGDLCLAAFFEGANEREREAARVASHEAVRASLASGSGLPAELREKRRVCAERIRPFHWMLEFPEIFHGKRADPLDSDQSNRAAWMDCFIGNPPFMGKNGISEMGGTAYLPWLQTLHVGAHGNADYSSHFFRRAFYLLGEHGTFGLIATNTIGQGDTRTTGLQPIVNSGAVVYEATRSQKWPGLANVAVSVVHVAKGHLTRVGLKSRVDGRSVAVVNSRLRSKPERPDPKPLVGNEGKSFQGSVVLGMGFVLTPQRRLELIQSSKKNAERIFRYIGGEEINSDPDPRLERYVINFGQMDLAESEKWPELIAIVRRDVKPERDKLKDNPDGRRRKQYWWQYGRYTPALYEALRPLKRCLVNSQVSKHMVFDWRPSDRVFAHTTYVYPIEESRWLAVLQSRVHEGWARLLSSSMRNDLRYAPSDCFETFPFPPADKFARLDTIGAELEIRRTTFGQENSIGLTNTYNQLKDAGKTSPAVQALREGHEALDRAVLNAYGWGDIKVPPYVGATGEQLEAFDDEVIDRLFTLNAERAKAEALTGTESPVARNQRARKPAAESPEFPLGLEPTPAKKRRTKTKE